MNLPMHEAHCQRFLCLCPDCEEQVPKDQLEEHQQEQHAPVTNITHQTTFSVLIVACCFFFFLNLVSFVKYPLQVKCKKCSMKMEKCKLPDHEVNASLYIHTLSPKKNKEGKIYPKGVCV